MYVERTVPRTGPVAVPEAALRGDGFSQGRCDLPAEPLDRGRVVLAEDERAEAVLGHESEQAARSAHRLNPVPGRPGAEPSSKRVHVARNPGW